MSSKQQPLPGSGVQFRHLVPGARCVLAVASGKGGVGKSSIAVNLAIALSKLGKKVGLLDADIYGPSIPAMLSTIGADIRLVDEKTIVPIERHGLKTISIGNLVPPERAAIWRGPMLHQALQQLLGGVAWGELDFFVVDLPPGTGDVHLTMMQSLKINGVVAVSTPQQVALADVRKCIDMFQQLSIPIIGMIENMAYFECRHGERYHPFGRGGAKAMSAALQFPFLGEIPLLTDIMTAGENGTPYAVQDANNIFRPIAEKILDLSRSGTQP